MGFRHVPHEHELSFYQESEQKFKNTSCNVCDEVISGPAYYCDTCGRFILHESCFRLPLEIEDPLHHCADHPLLLLRDNTSAFICNGCRSLAFVGFRYNCSECEFNLDIGCAFPNKDGKIKRSSDDQSENLITEIEHFLDSHKLLLFYCRKQMYIRCRACNMQFSSDASYGCPKCCFFFHKSCLEIPRAIQHRYHSHSLNVSAWIFNCCGACKRREFALRYWCSEDDFSLHISCAKNSMEHTPPLRHKCHDNHDLYCFVPHDSIGSEARCSHCDQLCESAFYTCFDCDFSVHLGCIPIPPKVYYSEHSHPLSLKDSFCEDESGVYYCYACGKSRNPNFPVYWCEECPEEVPYVAHVECIVSEEDDFCRSSSHTSDPKAINGDLQLEPVNEGEGDSKEQVNQLQSSWHDHPLILKAKEGAEIIPCDMCEREIEGDMYFCETGTGVYFHPSCAELPSEITSPLHINTLHAVFDNPYHFMCGLCKKFTDGYRYKSSQSSFALEVKCAILTNDQYQGWKEKPEVRIRHFSHPHHELILVKHTPTDVQFSLDDEFSCELCEFSLSVSTYCCLDCQFFIHESCSEEKQQMQPLYHPSHRLIYQELYGLHKNCGICGSEISDRGYSCHECHFSVHFRCGTRLTSTLKHKFHEHTLFSFSASDIWVSDFHRDDRFRCCECFREFRDSFYRCLECGLAVHPECIPLPKIVKHSDHDYHPLTLMSSMCEDDTGIHYCNVCDNLRNPNHPVYWCKECQIMECSFAAHVGCVIQEGDASLKVISWEDPEPIFGSLFDSEEADEIIDETNQEEQTTEESKSTPA